MKFERLYKTRRSVKNNQKFLLFLVFAAVILFKLFWFQGTVLSWEEYALSPWRAMVRFLPKLSIAMFFASFVFIVKRNWWTILISVLVDVWTIANVIYYRACGFFINSDALQMVDNMHGFWGSIFIFFTWREFVPVLITLLYAVFIVKSRKMEQVRHVGFFVAVLLLSVAMWIFVNICNHKVVIKDTFVRGSLSEVVRPVLDTRYDAYRAARNYYNHGAFTDWEKRYINRYSIVDYFFADISYFASSKYYARKINDFKHSVPITQSDKQVIDALLNDVVIAPDPQTNLVVIMFESLEGWIFEDYEGSENIAPNLRKLIGKENTLYAPRVKSQALQGNSGDGQMIVLTGVLPLKVGAACRLYGANSYPNYAHLFSTSATINPSPGAWNQREVNPNYGISQLIEFEGNDEQLVDSIIETGSKASSPFFLLAMTIASHSPFNCGDLPKSTLPGDMPKTLQKYLACVNYTDKALGKLISKIEDDPHWKNTTLVIVGDHVVFKEQMLEEFSKFGRKANISLKDKKNYVPLIVNSPSITSRVEKNDVFYQADVYPTILDLIGCSSYYWKGVGEDILSESQADRIDEESGYRLSDIIIRNNYFEKFSEFNKSK